MSQVCVYTTLLGNYERINEQHVAAGLQIPFICLTDDPDLRSESWQMRVVQPVFPTDPVRSQRDMKIRPHVYLPEFARSLYIDNSVILKQPPHRLFEIGAASPEGFVMPHHSFRQTVHDEFLEVAQLGLDDNDRVFEQLNNRSIIDREPASLASDVRRAPRAAWLLHLRDDRHRNRAAPHKPGQHTDLRLDGYRKHWKAV
jgi:hypothetical protein